VLWRRSPEGAFALAATIRLWLLVDHRWAAGPLSARPPAGQLDQSKKPDKLWELSGHSCPRVARHRFNSRDKGVHRALISTFLLVQQPAAVAFVPEGYLESSGVLTPGNLPMGARVPRALRTLRVD
jgi:hypothetical protein